MAQDDRTDRQMANHTAAEADSAEIAQRLRLAAQIVLESAQALGGVQPNVLISQLSQLSGDIRNLADVVEGADPTG